MISIKTCDLILKKASLAPVMSSVQYMNYLWDILIRSLSNRSIGSVGTRTKVQKKVFNSTLIAYDRQEAPYSFAACCAVSNIGTNSSVLFPHYCKCDTNNRNPFLAHRLASHKKIKSSEVLSVRSSIIVGSTPFEKGSTGCWVLSTDKGKKERSVVRFSGMLKCRRMEQH